jgi:hypothetical protein
MHEILSLRMVTLSDEEIRETRGTEPRVTAIIDRVEELSREVLECLEVSLAPARAGG